MQGDTFRPQFLVAQVETIAKFWEGNYQDKVFKFRGKVNIGILGCVDDLLGITEQGVHTVDLNSVLNTKSAKKGLRFGTEKKCPNDCESP